MAQIDELKTALARQRDALADQINRAESALNAAAEGADEAVRTKLAEVRSLLSAARDHLSAFADTAHVAADAQPARGAAPVAGNGNTDPVRAALVGGAPVGLSGVPVTPPGAAGAGTGPAVPHVDVGQRDVNGVISEAPAAVVPDAEPVLDPEPLREDGVDPMADERRMGEGEKR